MLLGALEGCPVDTSPGQETQRCLVLLAPRRVEQASLQQQPTKAGSHPAESRRRSWSLLEGFLLLWGLIDGALYSATVALAKLAELQG